MCAARPAQNDYVSCAVMWFFSWTFQEAMEEPGYVLTLDSMPELRSNSILFSNFFSLLPLFTDFYLVVRSQRSVGLVGGSPTYDLVEAFQAPDAPARTYQYSPDGRLFALAVPSGCVELQCL